MSDFNAYTAGLDMDFLRDLFRRNGRMMHFQKGDIFAGGSKRLRYWGLVVSGTFKYVIPDYEGERHVVGFVFDNDMVGDFLATVKQRPVRAEIIAASDAEVMVCDTSVVYDFMTLNTAFLHTITVNLFCQAYDMYLELHLKSPKDRYVALLKRCPDILQKITLREMASYLQVTPTHLSRIRKELTFGS
uniref:cAMP-binding protein n=1 Tax=uncultured Prevotella sp. TaxID=159272 RepID=A0A6G8F183_9BACT|nr:cAMP-binding protein [uncultured Prevotella sp.]